MRNYKLMFKFNCNPFDSYIYICLVKDRNSLLPWIDKTLEQTSLDIHKTLSENSMYFSAHEARGPRMRRLRSITTLARTRSDELRSNLRCAARYIPAVWMNLLFRWW